MNISTQSNKPCLIWITGLSASGKSTLANALISYFKSTNQISYLLDGDKLRAGINADLGYSYEDRQENIRRSGHIAKLFLDIGYIVVAAFISPKRSHRNLVKEIVGNDFFVEIFLDVSIEICIQRDPKGLYKKANSSMIKNFTGISQLYEKPEDADITFYDNFDLNSAVSEIIKFYYAK